MEVSDSAQWTKYRELNTFLRRFVADVCAAVSRAPAGVYLHGSFGLGDADRASDVDFIVVTAARLSDDEFERLQAMHERLYFHDPPWGQRLDGSYVDAESFRRHTPGRTTRYPYLDNGSRALEWSDHCDNHLTRWLVRERGITLAGASPEHLVDSVGADEIRLEALQRVSGYASWARESAPETMSVGKQSYVVLVLCRLLFAIVHGTIATKREAVEWAKHDLTVAWSALLERAIATRGSRNLDLLDVEGATATLQFVDLVESLAPELLVGRGIDAEPGIHSDREEQ